MSPHLYITDADDDEPPRVYNLDRADCLFVWAGRELCARYGTAHFAGDESHIPTIYEGRDARAELARILVWLEGGPDPCADRRAELRMEAE